MPMLFFGFAKGQIYPMQLADEFRHCVHWLREIALQKLQIRLSNSSEDDSIAMHNRADSPDTGLCFDWGKILVHYAKQDPSRFGAQVGGMVDIIRRETKPEVLATILDAGTGKSKDEAE